MKKTIFTILILLISVSAYAKEDFIENGFKAFKEQGVDAAFSEWAKNGPLEGTKEIKSQAAQFGQVGAYYGSYVSHDYVLTKEFSPNNKVVFVIINLETGPLYGLFLMYKNSKGLWTSPNFQFNTYPEQIWPSELFTGMIK